MRSYLVLENGKVYDGDSFGSNGDTSGEVGKLKKILKNEENR